MGNLFARLPSSKIGAWDFASRNSIHDFEPFNKLNELRQQALAFIFSGAVFDPGNGPRLIAGYSTGGMELFTFQGGGGFGGPRPWEERRHGPGPLYGG